MMNFTIDPLLLRSVGLLLVILILIVVIRIKFLRGVLFIVWAALLLSTIYTFVDFDSEIFKCSVAQKAISGLPLKDGYHIYTKTCDGDPKDAETIQLYIGRSSRKIEPLYEVRRVSLEESLYGCFNSGNCRENNASNQERKNLENAVQAFFENLEADE